ncbi:MAG: hypothetical protein ACE5JG_00875, partial [Planctomycetota bacterium]
MYWLRRIPTETRIVVIVICLALVQAILLSVFGLQAIAREREDAESDLLGAASVFVQDHLAGPVRDELRRLADQVFLAAFERKDPDWKEGPQPPGRGVFRDAFLLRPDGSIETPDGFPLHLPARRLRERRAEGVAAAKRLTRDFIHETEIGPAQRQEHALEYAKRHPFCVDEDEAPLGLLFALTPLHVGSPPGLKDLLRARWIGVLNRAAGRDVSRFFERLRAGAPDPEAYRRAAQEQDRGPARRLTQVVEESGRLRAARLEPGRILLRLPAGGEERHFYVR